MLDSYQIQQIREGLEQAYGLLAGDSITHVNGTSGKQTSLTALGYDNATKDGLVIDHGGLRLKGVREWLFLSSELSSKGVTLSEKDYFIVGSERWDFLEDAPIQRSIVPIAGIQNLVLVSLRRAVELTQTSTQAGIYTYG